MTKAPLDAGNCEITLPTTHVHDPLLAGNVCRAHQVPLPNRGCARPPRPRPLHSLSSGLRRNSATCGLSPNVKELTQRPHRCYCHNDRRTVCSIISSECPSLMFRPLLIACWTSRFESRCPLCLRCRQQTFGLAGYRARMPWTTSPSQGISATSRAFFSSTLRVAVIRPHRPSLLGLPNC